MGEAFQQEKSVRKALNIGLGMPCQVEVRLGGCGSLHVHTFNFFGKKRNLWT